jgi:site-specific recombinase XerD
MPVEVNSNLTTDRKVAPERAKVNSGLYGIITKRRNAPQASDSPRRFCVFMYLIEVIENYNKFSNITLKKNYTRRSVSGYDLDLRQFCLYMRNPHIENISEKDIVNYMTEMFALGWKANAVRIKATILKNIFKFALLRGMRVIPPELIPMPPREYHIPRVASDEEIKKVLEFCPAGTGKSIPARNRCIINFLRSTGCRNSELCSLNISQLMEHFDEKRVVIKTAKSKGVRPIRELFWDEETHKDLKEWLKVRAKLEKKVGIFLDKDALFVGIRGWQTGKRVTNYSVALFLRKLSKQANLDSNLNPHSFRHHRGHELNDLGANNSIISSVLGHSSLASSYVYTQMKSHELKTAAQKFRRA